MPRMPGRTSIDTDPSRGDTRTRDGAGAIPFEAFIFMGAICLVFIYGFWLRLSGPPASSGESARLGTVSRSELHRRDSGGDRSSHATERDPYGSEKPILPEHSITGTGPSGETGYSSGADPESLEAPPVADVLPGASTRPDAPEDDPLPHTAGPQTGAPAARTQTGRDSPRGATPASAERRARDLLSRKEYRRAAEAFAEWARAVPAGSWTVQIGVLPRLDAPAAGRPLTAVASRRDVFILPPGTLPKGYAPVCAGVYPDEDAARRAAQSLAALPGASGSPIPKRLDRLAGG